MKLIILLLLPLFLTSQKLVEIPHTINIKSLQYSAKHERDMLTFKPVQYVKLTLKTGINGNFLSKIDMNSLTSGKVLDAFDEVNPDDYKAIAKYDIRMKIYVCNRWRILLRSNILWYGQNMETIGFIWKM